MGTSMTNKTGSIVVSALSARANFGKLLDRVDDERRSLVIERRGTPEAVLLSTSVITSNWAAPGTGSAAHHW
jgi:prevent-host-death family protein